MKKNRWGKIVPPIMVGIVLGVGATLFAVNERIAKLEGQRAATNTVVGSPVVVERVVATTPVPDVSNGRLSEIIQAAQKTHVKESWGELAHQAFTDADLQTFRSTRRANAIAEKEASKKEFLEIALMLKRLSPTDREQTLETAIRPLRPTWTELGRISREGQTDAGQQAEILIAEAIVQKAENLLNQSEHELQEQYAE